MSYQYQVLETLGPEADLHLLAAVDPPGARRVVLQLALVGDSAALADGLGRGVAVDDAGGGAPQVREAGAGVRYEVADLGDFLGVGGGARRVQVRGDRGD